MSIKKYKLLHFVFVVVFFLLIQGSSVAKEINIVTTTMEAASIASSITDEHAAIESICDASQDPHFLQAKPGYILMARDADLWVRIGMDLEIGWESPVLDGSRNFNIKPGMPGHLDLSEKIIKLEVPSVKVTRGMGDVHPQGNPHYWLDPLNGRIMAGEIAKRLCQIDIKNCKNYKKNLKNFKHLLDKKMFGEALCNKVGGSTLWSLILKGRLESYLKANELFPKAGGWYAAMRPFVGKDIVTMHKSWTYFAKRFGLNVIAELEPKPGIPPTPSHIKEVIELMEATDTKIILQEPFYTRKAADKIAIQTGSMVVVCPNTSKVKDANGYFELFDDIIRRLSEAFKSQK